MSDETIGWIGVVAWVGYCISAGFLVYFRYQAWKETRQRRLDRINEAK